MKGRVKADPDLTDSALKPSCMEIVQLQEATQLLSGMRNTALPVEGRVMGGCHQLFRFCNSAQVLAGKVNEACVFELKWEDPPVLKLLACSDRPVLNA